MLKRLTSRYWLLFPLLILVVVVIDRLEAPSTTPTEDTLDMRETRSDYYLEAFRSRRYDTTGKLQYIIEGDALAHYPDDDRSEITNPSMQLIRPLATWEIHSNNGLYNPDPDRFTLSGQVTIERISDGVETITMSTDALTVEIDQNRVTTSSPITITASSWQLEATGMTSSIDDGQLVLHSEVAARYEMENATR